jgi:hypothetical protein
MDESNTARESIALFDSVKQEASLKETLIPWDDAYGATNK